MSDPSSNPTRPNRPPLPTQEELEEILRRAASASVQNQQPLTIPVRPTKERRDERCWQWSSQTNARRALKQDPKAKMLCFINLRNEIAEMTPVPGQPPGVYFVKDKIKTVPSTLELDPSLQSTSSNETPSVLPGPRRYHVPFLENRYIYFATGRETIARHMIEMGTEWKGIESIQQRIKENEAAAHKSAKEDYEERMRKALNGQEDETETLYHLSASWSNTFTRFENHLVRIYGPGFRALARLPSTFTDGTQSQMLDLVVGKLTDGSAFTLLGRMSGSLREVGGRVWNGWGRRGPGGGDGEPPTGGPIPPIAPTVPRG
ncbi:hypothetical protein T439DRAFT_320122 [Meredithblackwellia eburnea MCA 4105]